MSAQRARARFFGAATYARAQAGSKPVELYEPRFGEPGETTALHRVGAGERLDLIAHRYFSDPHGFFRIADQNECLEAEDLLEPGRTLKIGEGG